MTPPWRTLSLANGLQLIVADRTVRYFGDYHRVRLDVRIDCDLAQADMPADLLTRARGTFGPTAVFERRLERMGVAGSQVENVREELLHAFLEHTRTYLEHPDFCRRLVARLLAQSRAAGAPPAAR